MTERPGGYALNAPQEASLPHRPGARGRGARSNISGRYESVVHEAFDDGWTEADGEPPRLATTVLKDASRSIISTNQSPDISFDQSINPYRGCEHGCVYCYARPSHAFWGYSPGLDFESVIFAKPDGPALLEAIFNKIGYQPKPILIGANTDAWQPLERERQHTRDILKVCARYRHPISVITKSALIRRDLDILADARREFEVPLAAYHVSGEYSMIKAAGERGWLDADRAMEEALVSIKRAGADLILTYAAADIAEKL